MASPLPGPLLEFFAAAAKPSPSLFLERGYDGYTDDWKDHDPQTKREFLKRVVSLLGDNALGLEYARWLKRHSAALKGTGASSRDIKCATALLVGIGRKNPSESGLTLDRATGSPYVPGSSVKGLLRSTVSLVSGGEIGTADERQFWTTHGDRLLGTGASAGRDGSQGALAFYDAYPTRLDVLELGVITPHYQPYYSNPSEVPADWFDPVPVPLLQVKPGTTFHFWFRAPDEPVGAYVESLLRLGLDWLGLGAKTSSGFGWFEPPHGPSSPANRQVIVMEQAELTYMANTGILGIVNDKAWTSEAQLIEAIPNVRERIKKKKKVFAKARIEILSNQRKIIGLEAVSEQDG